VTLEKLPGLRLDSSESTIQEIARIEKATPMARKKLTMRHIQEILRLKYQNQLSLREIARSCRLAASTVGDYLKRAEAASLGWPLPEGLTEEQLIQQLFGSDPETPAPSDQPLPDWSYIHQELRRQGVTLQLLWEEYRQSHPQGYSYSRFCELYHLNSRSKILTTIC
jgi:hypothetical protein